MRRVILITLLCHPSLYCVILHFIVILSVAKDLCLARREILRCAQDDRQKDLYLARREILRCAQDDSKARDERV